MHVNVPKFETPSPCLFGQYGIIFMLPPFGVYFVSFNILTFLNFSRAIITLNDMLIISMVEDHGLNVILYFICRNAILCFLHGPVCCYVTLYTSCSLGAVWTIYAVYVACLKLKSTCLCVYVFMRKIECWYE